MHIQYTNKLRKIFKQSKIIIPTYYQTFYSVLKLCCESISSQDVTPEFLDALSKIYAYCKERVQVNFNVTQPNQTNNNLNNKQQHPNKNVNKNLKNNEQKYYNMTHKELSQLLLPFVKHLPQTTVAKLIYNHFLSPSFYNIIQKQCKIAQQLIMSDGSTTPLAKPIKIDSSKNIPVNDNNGNSIKEEGFTAGLNNVLKNKLYGSKLHIYGTNQLSIIFWLNSFKFDYAVHFDVFWQNFQNYLNNILVQKNNNNLQKPSQYNFYSNFIPNYNNQSVKQKIRQLVDPFNKYYVTSANCNELFMHLSEPELLNTLAELTTVNLKGFMDYKSTKCLVLKYKWKDNNNEKGKTEQVFINNFGISNNSQVFQGKDLLQKTLLSTQAYPQNKQIILTGNSIGYQNKILYNKYSPTIRFGSLNDNQICMKNKYISRRQFMIIQEMEIEDQDNNQGFQAGHTGHGSKFSGFIRKNKYGKVLFKSQRSQKFQSMLESKYYLVCISPSNHTALVYQKKMQVKPGLIFKYRGVHIQIVKLVSVYAGISPQRSKLQKQKQYENQTQTKNNNQIYNISNSNQNERPLDNSTQTQTNFQLLTTIPVMKTQQYEQQQQIQKTLQQLPTNTSQLLIDKKLQCRYLSGLQKNKKILVQPANPVINILVSQDKQDKQEQFRFQIQNGVFYIPKNVEILAKNANQVLSGHLSDKVLVRAGMRIVLEELQFQVLE